MALSLGGSRSLATAAEARQPAASHDICVLHDVQQEGPWVLCPLPLRTALQQAPQRPPDTEMLNMVSVPMRCVNIECRASAARGVDPALKFVFLWHW